MYVARILYPVEVLGPGKRVGIWFCGCPRRCKGCSNPELWEFQERYRTTPQHLFDLISQIAKVHPVDGFTITGGEPLFQADELQALVALIRHISSDILVYTGYQISELPAEQLAGIAVLVDGEYVESRNTNCILRGSDNQTIHVLDPTLQNKYREYIMSTSNQLQNFMTADGVVSVGIHKPGFISLLDANVTRKGLAQDERVETKH